MDWDTGGALFEKLAEGGGVSKGDRIEVLWAVREDGADVERWLPGVLLNRHEDGRCVVKMDNGWYCNDAAPQCVREAQS
jgi:hypothetical protein